jgi:hypothetical protein
LNNVATVISGLLLSEKKSTIVEHPPHLILPNETVSLYFASKRFHYFMKVSRQIIAYPFFLFLLPFFFVFHGYTQNKASVTGRDVLELTAEYLLAAGVLFLISYLLFRRWQKAALFSFGLLCIHFFFGPMQDALKKISPGFFLSKYSVLLPLLLCAVGIIFHFLKKWNSNFHRLFLYLNLLLLLLILLDVPSLFQNNDPIVTKRTFPICATCDKPDVYLIIADEYADSVSLAETMQFNNDAFLEQLRQRGFHVVEDSHSNYNFTPFAMASLFQMNYLPNITGSNSNRNDRNTCAAIINHNPLLQFFKENNYSIKNFSIFNVDGQPTKARQKYLLMGKDLITSQTLLQRLLRDLGYHLVTTLKLKSEIERYAYYTKRCNEKLINLLQNETLQKSNQPRFVYTHLLMPHYPYYFDQNGNERPLSFFAAGYEFDQKAYTEYLQYCNRIFLQLIDAILQHSAKPPVIVFMGDHGFREFAKPTDSSYYYRNMNAVLLPDQNFGPFYKGISGINQFRALLNAAFGQHLPMLKDSTVLIRE